MQILQGEKCPKCGGHTSLEGTIVQCLSCEWSLIIQNKRDQALLKDRVLVIPEVIKLTSSGNALLHSDLEIILNYRRLLRNHMEGYILRDLDKLLLMEAGFAVEVESDR